MRLDWQCPTCFAELGDKSHARMLTCPYCGSLLIVKSDKKEFYLVKKDVGWYFFKKKDICDFSGYLKFGGHEEYYRYENGEWYLKKDNDLYILTSKIDCKGASLIDEGKVEYIWGELPVIAPPRSVIRDFKDENFLCREVSGKIYIFKKIKK